MLICIIAATQRNLSSQDTDLIELTLTTIYELDKLLHLLRDRSENLELLGTRITWDEYRTSAWVDRRTLLADMTAFLAARGRWSVRAYDVLPPVDVPGRRDSVASIASDTSGSLGFSRSARFKLAEMLSRDAAQLGARVTAIQRKVNAAGKALDTLIDQSRRPVPEELLDEQDKIEDKGIKELENLADFVHNIVVQWRK